MTPIPSFQELSPRERIVALLGEQPQPKELLGPFDRLFSPWLARQGSVPQADDGIVLVRGTVAGQRVVAIAIEAAFEGGSIGESGGAKMAGALELAAKTSREGRSTAALLLLETGGVRLGEANLGLAAIARIQRAIVDLRTLAPVIAVVAGPTGCFGGMSLTAELCTSIIGTPFGRLGMNGPEVIELEAGPDELDAGDRELIWQMIGCEHRLRQGFIDACAEDTAVGIREAVHGALAGGPRLSQRLARLEAQLQAIHAAFPPPVEAKAGTCPPSRARRWLDALCGDNVRRAGTTPSVLLGEFDLAGHPALAIAVVPDPHSPMPRAAAGQLGLLEGWTLAATIRDFTARQAEAGTLDPILALVDTPGQAFGRVEETLCISAACAAAVEAYAEARRAGHPVLTLVVGQAISGAFLAHGLQTDHIIALDDSSVMMHAMSPGSIARITRRTLAEVESASANVPPMSYRITAAHDLGIVDTLLEGIDPESPTKEALATVRHALNQGLARRTTEAERKQSLQGNPLRTATADVDRLLRQQWHGSDPA